jgi:hypothetical protein
MVHQAHTNRLWSVPFLSSREKVPKLVRGKVTCIMTGLVFFVTGESRVERASTIKRIILEGTVDHPPTHFGTV